MPTVSTPTPPGTRDRLIAAMTDALRTRGYHGTGLSDILQQAGAPKGVLYHHFPGGKADLAVAAIDRVVDRMESGLDQLLAREPDPVQATRQWLEAATGRLQASGFESGCPLATIALETTAADTGLREALARAFERLRQRLATALAQGGHEPQRAGALAALIVSAYEGGLLQARVAHSTDPLTRVTDALLDLLAPARQSHSHDTGAHP
ncbi:TetR/AcrR family transcriptional regulator [uncultured Hydrogenophaga sp.]|uniref:TetR/AcrR family transcriptional regulator n=1 Tax=uncultured Hydrogenophaga sp. TaxID=199683 RepID=UPI00265D7B6D|nr:TetR/AcrR family transcriptional regulator [uncultured Hydrogenophaga sp.]